MAQNGSVQIVPQPFDPTLGVKGQILKFRNN